MAGLYTSNRWRNLTCQCGHALQFHKLRSGHGECFAVKQATNRSHVMCGCLGASVPTIRAVA